MSNTAALGFAIDSSAARNAAADLDKLAVSAGKAEGAAEGLASADKELAGSLAGLLAELRSANAALTGIAGSSAQVATATTATAAAMDKLATATAREAVAAKESKSEHDKLAASVDSLRAKFTPLTAVSREYQASLKLIADAERQGGISAREAANHRLAAAQAAETQMNALRKVADAEEAGQRGRLAAYQKANLQSQALDVGTSLASGMPLPLIAAQQGPQIFEALSTGNGVRANVKALGEEVAAAGLSVIRFLGPAGLVITGLGAATAAAIYFGDKTEENLEKIAKAAKSYSEYLKEIERGQRGIAAGAQAVFDRDQRLSPAALAQADKLEMQRQRDAIKAARENALNVDPVDTNLLPNIFNDAQNLARTISGETSSADVKLLARQLNEGSRSSAAIRSDLMEMRANPDLPGYLADAVDKMLEFVNAASAAESRIKSITDKAAELRRSLAFEDAASAASDFQRFVPNTRSDREQINRAYQERVAAAGRLGGNDRGTAESMRTAAANDLAKALADVDRQETVIRQGRVLDIEGVNARTVAERARIASERERLALSGEVMDAAEREARISHAAAVVYEEDARQQADALRDRARARGDMVTSMQLEAATFDVTRGAAEAYRRQQEMILQLYRDAEDTGRVVDPAEVQAIKDATAAAGALTDQLDRLRLVREQMEDLRGLQVQAGTFGMDDDAARRAGVVYDMQRKLREQNEDVSSDFAKTLTANALAMSDYGDAIRRQADAWGDVRSAGENAIDSVVDAMASGKADIGDMVKSIASDFTKTFLELGVSNPLKNALFGTSYGTLGDLFGKTVAPALGGAGSSALGTVTMTAAVVNLNGSPLGLGALTGSAGSSGGAAGAITKLLNPGNDNASSGGASAYRDAIAAIESRGSGGYSALGPITGSGDRAYGRYQVMGNNIGPWSKEALGRSISSAEFMANPNLQDQIFDKKFGGYVSKFGERGAAQAWFGGPGSVGKEGRKDMLGTSIGGYGDKFEKELAKLPPAGEKAASSATAFASTASDLTSGLSGTFASLDQEMLRIANDFTPAFGGALQSVLDAFASSLGTKGGFSGSWVSALASSITGGMTGAPGGGDAWAGLRIGANANGTDNWPGGLSWVGEKGPEIVNLPRGAQVVPNDLSRAIMAQPSGGGPINVNVVNQTGVQATADVNRNPDGSIDIMLSRKVAEEVGTRGKPANRVLREQGRLRRLS